MSKHKMVLHFLCFLNNSDIVLDKFGAEIQLHTAIYVGRFC